MRKKIFIISIITFLIDMSTKYFVKDLVIIKNFFEFKRVINDGAAWSILSSKRLMLILVGVCAIYFIIKFISDFKENKRNTLAFGLLLGGCLGNLYDRVIYGYVRDFIYFKFGSYSYPIFNIADIGIVIGTILLLYACLKGEEDGSRSIKRRKNR